MVFFEDHLLVETFIIGYKNEGESIVFFIRADGGIYFSGLVDCYEVEKLNKVRGILEENGVKELDFICWTHPDLDHSKGLKKIIDEYASSQTYIWIPEGVEAEEITCSKDVKDLFAYLKACSLNPEAVLNVYSVSDRKDLMYYNSICFQKGTERYPLQMVSYAPNSKKIRKQYYMDKFIRNDKSIFFELAIGGVRILLTGDMEDATIEEIPRLYFREHVNVLKIPHHGSDTSAKMLELGWDGCDIACSTVYRKGHANLPLEDIMIQYCETAEEVFCTGNADKGRETELYGVVRIVTDVVENRNTAWTEGNAGIWNAKGLTT